MWCCVAEPFAKSDAARYELSGLLAVWTLLTLLVSFVLYYRFELPMMQIGKRLTRPQPQSAHAL